MSFHEASLPLDCYLQVHTICSSMTSWIFPRGFLGLDFNSSSPSLSLVNREANSPSSLWNFCMRVLASSHRSTDSEQSSSRDENLAWRAASAWRMGSQVSASAKSMILAASSERSSGIFLCSRIFSLRNYSMKQRNIHSTFLHTRKQLNGHQCRSKQQRAQLQMDK